jgi:hypothetical protein
LVQRKNRKPKKKVIATSSTYEAFKSFLADKGSKIALKYIPKNLPKANQTTTKETFRKFFLSAGKNIENETSAEEKFLINLFKRFSEIDSSLENLRSVPVYLKYFPKVKSFAKAGITERKYMIYHIENYFQEIYILKERMKRFLKFISKRFKKKNQTQISDIMGGCLEAFESECKKVINIRGRHVHEERYTDEDLHTLTLFDHVKENHPALKVGYYLLLFSEKSRWIKWIDQNNKLLTFMLDEIFKVVNKHVI